MLKYAPFIALMISAPLAAQAVPAPAAPTQAAPATKVDPLDRIVCRSEETSGSRLKKHKVCATVREWQEQREENRDAVDLYQRKGYSIPNSG
jgi:hypothetical protein